MKFDCTYCDVIVDDSEKEEYEHHKSRGHELLQILDETRDEKKSEEDQKNTSEKIYQFAKTKIKKLVVDKNDSSKVYALVESHGNTQTLDLTGSEAKTWIRYSYFKETSKNHSEDAYTNALILIRAEAVHDGAVREIIFNRIAMTEDAIYYDLSSPDWKAIKITKDAVNTIKLDESTPIFVRKQSQSAQVTPVFEDSDTIEDLSNLLRIPQKDKQIFKVHMVSMFLEGFPIPIMSIVGEHGSIKSTISKSVKQIVDPSEAKTISLSTSTENLVLSIHNRYCVCFDNVSKINQQTSDILCKAITGDGTAKRKLYTDSDEEIYNYKRKIILNGISPNMEFPDLIDRNITYTTQKVPEEERITEEDFGKNFYKLLPLALGQIFKTLSKAMVLHDTVKAEVKHLPRMADFAIWGECIARVLGYEPFSFVNNYKDRIKSHSLEILDTYPIVSIVEKLIQDSDHYEKTIQEFFNEIKTNAESEGIDTHSRYVNFPRAANKIREHIARLKPTFRSIGIEIDIALYTKRDNKHHKNRQVIYIDRIKNTIAEYGKEHLPSLPSLPEQSYEQIVNPAGSHSGRDNPTETTPSLPYFAKFMPSESSGRDGKHGRDTNCIGV